MHLALHASQLPISPRKKHLSTHTHEQSEMNVQTTEYPYSFRHHQMCNDQPYLGAARPPVSGPSLKHVVIALKASLILANQYHVQISASG